MKQKFTWHGLAGLWLCALMTFLLVPLGPVYGQTGVYSFGHPALREGGIVLCEDAGGQGIYIAGYREDSTLIMLVDYNGNVLNELTFKVSGPGERDVITDFKYDAINNEMVGTGLFDNGTAIYGGYVFQFFPGTFTLGWVLNLPINAWSNFTCFNVQDFGPGFLEYRVYGYGNGAAYCAYMEVDKATGNPINFQFYDVAGPSDFAASAIGPAGNVYVTGRYGHNAGATSFRQGVFELNAFGNLLTTGTHLMPFAAGTNACLYGLDITMMGANPVTTGGGDFTGANLGIARAFWSMHDPATNQTDGFEIDLPFYNWEFGLEVLVVPNGGLLTYVIFGEGGQAAGFPDDLWMLSMNQNGTLNWAFSYGGPAAEFNSPISIAQQEMIQLAGGGSAQLAFTGTTNSYSPSEDVFLVMTTAAGTFDAVDLPCVDSPLVVNFTTRIANDPILTGAPPQQVPRFVNNLPTVDPNLTPNVVCGGAFPCFAATDPDYTPILVPTTFDITTSPSGTETWRGNYYIAADITIDGIVLDVTQTDVVFDPCTRITLINGARLRANNSTFRPCDELQSWEGIYFTTNALGITASGVIDECVFKNAVSALDITGSPGGMIATFDVRITNNLFVNCQRGINIGNGVPLIMNEGITGNTFTIDERPITWSITDPAGNCITYASLNYAGLAANGVTFNGQVSQNDFINTSDVLTTVLNGILWSRSSGTISLNNFTNNYSSIMFRNCSRSSIENNQVELTQLFSPFQTQFIIGGSKVIWVTGNELTNSTESGGINLFGAAISVDFSDLVNVKENTVNGFSDGIQLVNSNNTTVQENTITNTNAVAIYVQDGSNDSVSCNVISARYPTVAGFTTLGVYYVTTLNVAPTLNIKGNCIMNTDMAISADNFSGGVLPLPRIHNNYLYNYRSFGVVSLNFNGSIGSSIVNPASAGRNSFISNNILGGAVDIEPNGQPVTSFGDYGINTIGVGVTLVGNGMYNSITSCGRQIGTVSSTIGTGEICDLFMANIDGSFWRIAQGDFSDFPKGYYKGSEGASAIAILRNLVLDGEVLAAERFEAWVDGSDHFTSFDKAFARYTLLDATHQNSAALNQLPNLEALNPGYRDFVTIESIRLNLLLSGRTFSQFTTEELATLEGLDAARQTFADDARALLNLGTNRHPYIIKPVRLPEYERSARTINVMEQNLTLLPNPAKGQVKVEYVLDPGEKASLRVLDATGRMLLSTPLQADVSSTTLDISSLSAGMYFVSLVGEKGAQHSAKLIVR